MVKDTWCSASYPASLVFCILAVSGQISATNVNIVDGNATVTREDINDHGLVKVMISVVDTSSGPRRFSVTVISTSEMFHSTCPDNGFASNFSSLGNVSFNTACTNAVLFITIPPTVITAMSISVQSSGRGFISYGPFVIGTERIDMQCPEGGETTIQIHITNISQCHGNAPPHDVNITAGNDYAIFHANGTMTHMRTTLFIKDSRCENSNTFLFSVELTADHPIVVKATIINALQNGTDCLADIMPPPDRTTLNSVSAVFIGITTVCVIVIGIPGACYLFIKRTWRKKYFPADNQKMAPIDRPSEQLAEGQQEQIAEGQREEIAEGLNDDSNQGIAAAYRVEVRETSKTMTRELECPEELVLISNALPAAESVDAAIQGNPAIETPVASPNQTMAQDQVLHIPMHGNPSYEPLEEASQSQIQEPALGEVMGVPMHSNPAYEPLEIAHQSLTQGPDSRSHPMSHWNDAALVYLKDKLKLNVQLSMGLSDILEKPAGGFMSYDEAERIMQLPNSMEQMNRVIETLRGKRDEDFQTFCVMLRECNYSVWADELEREAEHFKARGVKGSFELHVKTSRLSSQPARAKLDRSASRTGTAYSCCTATEFYKELNASSDVLTDSKGCGLPFPVQPEDDSVTLKEELSSAMNAAAPEEGLECKGVWALLSANESDSHSEGPSQLPFNPGHKCMPFSNGTDGLWKRPNLDGTDSKPGHKGGDSDSGDSDPAGGPGLFFVMHSIESVLKRIRDQIRSHMSDYQAGPCVSETSSNLIWNMEPKIHDYFSIPLPIQPDDDDSSLCQMVVSKSPIWHAME